MKTLNFVIFFSIFFIVYGALNYYIFIRGWQCLPAPSPLRVLYIIAFIAVAMSFIAGRILESVWLCRFSEIFVWVGSFWLAAMLYYILAAVFLDLLRLLNHWLHFFPSYVTSDYEKAKQAAALIVSAAVAVLLTAGDLNAAKPRIKFIHLGTIVGRKRFDNIVSTINEQNPDIVLLPGDIVDEDLGPVIKENLGEALKNIRSKYGVFAVTGNHEYIGGVEPACKYLTDHNVTLLRDSVVKLNNSLYIVGREDRSISQFTGKRRKPLEELMKDVDKSLPVILMDHQPFKLEEASRNGVDFQLSGHTHHGQLWPLNLITRMVYQVSWGSARIGETQFYVSCGVGTWGPPVRTGNCPEILNIKFSFGTGQI